MDERERRRLLRLLTGHDPEPAPEPAYAISDAVRGAWHDAVTDVAHIMHARLEAILREWGYDPTANATHDSVTLDIRTADEPARARVAHVVTLTENAREDDSERRAARFVAGYELVVAENGALAFARNITPTEFGRVIGAVADLLAARPPAEA